MQSFMLNKSFIRKIRKKYIYAIIKKYMTRITDICWKKDSSSHKFCWKGQFCFRKKKGHFCHVKPTSVNQRTLLSFDFALFHDRISPDSKRTVLSLKRTVLSWPNWIFKCFDTRDSKYMKSTMIEHNNHIPRLGNQNFNQNPIEMSVKLHQLIKS